MIWLASALNRSRLTSFSCKISSVCLRYNDNCKDCFWTYIVVIRARVHNFRNFHSPRRPKNLLSNYGDFWTHQKNLAVTVTWGGSALYINGVKSYLEQILFNNPISGRPGRTCTSSAFGPLTPGPVTWTLGRNTYYLLGFQHHWTFEDFKHEIDIRDGYLFELSGQEAQDVLDFKTELRKVEVTKCPQDEKIIAEVVQLLQQGSNMVQKLVQKKGKLTKKVVKEGGEPLLPRLRQIRATNMSLTYTE